MNLTKAMLAPLVLTSAITSASVSGTAPSNNVSSNLRSAGADRSRVAWTNETMLDSPNPRNLRTFHPDTYKDADTANAAHKSAATAKLMVAGSLAGGVLLLTACAVVSSKVKECCNRRGSSAATDKHTSPQTPPTTEMTSAPERRQC